MAPTRIGLPDISMTQMEYLVAVQETSTWANAAQALGVSQSALSQGLAELQRRLGIELFTWDGRRRSPTSAATEVTEHFRRILALTSDLSRWTDRVRAGSAGKLRVGMIDAAAVDHFGDALKEFRENSPELDLHITVGPSGQLLEDLAKGDLDVSVCVGADRTGFAQVPLLEEDLYIYAPPETKACASENWGPWVTFPRGSVTRDLIENALRSAGAPFSGVAESNQPEVHSELVHIGMGWTVLPRMQAERPPASLIPIHTTPLLKRTLSATTRETGLTNPAASDLIAKLQQEAKNLALKQRKSSS